ncbi:hypothetical protein BS47DRAFT_1352126, partial [Hydnum rufescens UP504]
MDAIHPAADFRLFQHQRREMKFQLGSLNRRNDILGFADLITTRGLAGFAI